MPLAYRYRIKQGCTVLLNNRPGRPRLKPGDYLPSDYPAKKTQALLRAGKIIPENLTVHPEFIKDEPVADVPGVDTAPIGSAPKDGFLDATNVRDPGAHYFGGKTRISGPAGIQTTSGRKSRNPAGSPVTQQHSPWVLDPANLQGKNLDQLNVIILDRDPQASPCTSVEEAIAMLSLDFVPPEATSVQEKKPSVKESNSQVATTSR